MNTNKRIKMGLLVIVLAFFGTLSFAQKVIVTDTIDAEEAFSKKHITQVPLEQCEQIDTCTIATSGPKTSIASSTIATWSL